MNVNNRKSLTLFLACAILLSVFVLPATVVQAQSMVISGPNSASIGQTFDVTIAISPPVTLTNGFDVNVGFDSGGLRYNGQTALVPGLTPRVTTGSGVIVLGYSGGNASAGNVYRLSFTTLSAGNFLITVGDGRLGGGTAASGGNMAVQVAGAGQPPANVIAAALPTIGPTPISTVPPVTLPPATEGPTEPQLTDPETGESMLTFYTFDGMPLRPVDEEIPAELILFDYEPEVTVIQDVNVQILRADNRPRLFYLETEDGEAGLYLHWQAEDRYLPFRLIEPVGERFVIMAPPSNADLPDDFEQVELEIDGQIFPAFRPASDRYRLIGSEADEDTGIAPDLYVVYARIQREPEIREGTEVEETLPVETTPDGLPVVTEATEPAETEAPAELEPWEEGEFYFYDETRSMLFPLSLMLLQVPEVTPTPTPEPTAPPTEATEPVPVETIPVDAEPVISLFGYEYGLWKTIIFVLGFLLLLTWLILLIRSLGKKSREVEREQRLELARRQAMMRNRERMPDLHSRGDLPLRFEERPDRPEPNLVVPPSTPLTVEAEKPAESHRDKTPAGRSDGPYTPARRRENDLPEMPTLEEPRPAPLPPVRNTKRTHADEMVIRPLPADITPEPARRQEPDTGREQPLERPVIRRVEIESRKPKIRRPDRPVIDDQDNSEI